MASMSVLREIPRRAVLSSSGLSAVEASMMRLAIGDQRDMAGSMVTEALTAGGKRLRARLALAAGEALGLQREALIPWAAACEILHNATLIHDDIQDGDQLRRGHPTTWSRYGVGQAINAGDLALMLPFLAISELNTTPVIKMRLHESIARAAARTARGQAEEMFLPQKEGVTWEDWVWAAEGKSGVLLGLPVQGAALLANLDMRAAETLGRIFAKAGVLYQLQDDLLDLSDQKGKARRASDIQEGKINALIVAHLSLYPEQAAETLAFLQSPTRRTDAGEVDAFVHRLWKDGAVAYVQEQLSIWARAVLQDPLLCSIPALLAVAQELVERVVQSAQTVSLNLQENAV